ncbi:hypothetical protein VitviT2T_005363 [Vitis vinifera]|uniref:Uncharacterized protein n=1 Tax=Vitis vinifera TaxID=29760 RepID=A0ABY9BSQ9_VITVI|nr:uncharacterized protein LOC104879146 [Vitis vinifera]WJZ85846.1 hypothetical protein VitviT2T_005363 [Vitis vinifera]|eukprot:XP_010649257.1 PREDICTED: uncharacterized protein LOC104879146 [Vitis vinifera]
MEGEGVLLIATKQRLLVVDLTKLQNLDSTDTEFPAAPLSAVKVFNFVEKGFPFGASFFMRESKLYMVGGEKTRAGLSEEELCTPSSANLDESFGKRGLSPYIYVSDLTTLDSITQFREHPLTMLAPKTSPIIEEIEGKIYALSGPSCHYKDFLPAPVFEVYDPSLDRLEALPLPLFYQENSYDGPAYIIHDYSVVGTTIYVRAGDNYYSYSVNDRIWDFLGNSRHEIPVQAPLLPGINGKFVPAYKDILICFSLHALSALMLPQDGGPPLIQFLHEVYEDRLDMVSWREVGVIVALGEHEMCVIRPKVVEIENVIIHRIYVATFRVEKLNSSSPAPKLAKSASNSQTSDHDSDVQDTDDSAPIQDSDNSAPVQDSNYSVPFLSVTCLSKGFYNLPEWGCERPKIRSAFFHRWSKVSPN